MSNKRIGLSVQLEEEDIHYSCGLGGGGALCFVLDHLPKRAPAIVQVMKVSFSRNAATRGGTVLVDSNYHVCAEL